MAEGLGEPMARVALAWAIGRPGVTSVIVGARNPGQLLRNIEAADLVLGEEAVRALDAATDPLKAKLGPNADMWCSEADSRIR